MGVRFSKSIKLGKLVKLNISKSGISASIGKKGASINLGSKGTYLNISPSAVGVKSTGLSYRQKIANGYSNVFNSLTNNRINKKDENKATTIDTKQIDDYNEEYETNTNLFKYTENAKTKEELLKEIDKFDNQSSKEIFMLAQNGDEETIESLVEAFLNNLELNFEVKANYELDNDILYVDLDLPEIENIKQDYPTIQNEKIVYKKKTTSALKEEYSKTVMSLGIYLACNFFNISGFINQIILSAFTSIRNKDGDLKDCYLYSIKFSRDVFEKTDLKSIDDPYDFILKFENRININNFSFKEITPYSNNNTKSYLKDAIDGLKQLGYKQKDISSILSKLEKQNYDNSGDYIKAALKMLNKS